MPGFIFPAAVERRIRCIQALLINQVGGYAPAIAEDVLRHFARNRS